MAFPRNIMHPRQPRRRDLSYQHTNVRYTVELLQSDVKLGSEIVTGDVYQFLWDKHMRVTPYHPFVTLTASFSEGVTLKHPTLEREFTELVYTFLMEEPKSFTEVWSFLTALIFEEMYPYLMSVGGKDCLTSLTATFNYWFVGASLDQYDKNPNLIQDLNLREQLNQLKTAKDKGMI